MNLASMRYELEKMAEGISSVEALQAVKKLRDLEANKPKPDEIARGALAGGVAGTASTLARGIVTGDLAKGVGNAVRGSTNLRGALWNMGKGVAKGVGGSLVGSAAFGATLPFARRFLDQEAEKAKLKNYLGQGRSSRTLQTVKETLGV